MLGYHLAQCCRYSTTWRPRRNLALWVEFNSKGKGTVLDTPRRCPTQLLPPLFSVHCTCLLARPLPAPPSPPSIHLVEWPLPLCFPAILMSLDSNSSSRWCHPLTKFLCLIAPAAVLCTTQHQKTCTQEGSHSPSTKCSLLHSETRQHG